MNNIFLHRDFFFETRKKNFERKDIDLRKSSKEKRFYLLPSCLPFSYFPSSSTPVIHFHSHIRFALTCHFQFLMSEIRKLDFIGITVPWSLACIESCLFSESHNGIWLRNRRLSCQYLFQVTKVSSCCVYVTYTLFPLVFLHFLLIHRKKSRWKGDNVSLAISPLRFGIRGIIFDSRKTRSREHKWKCFFQKKENPRKSLNEIWKKCEMNTNFSSNLRKKIFQNSLNRRKYWHQDTFKVTWRA